MSLTPCWFLLNDHVPAAFDFDGAGRFHEPATEFGFGLIEAVKLVDKHHRRLVHFSACLYVSSPFAESCTAVCG